ncbi:unnamed protein product [Phaeothamnion confervicola]
MSKAAEDTAFRDMHAGHVKLKPVALRETALAQGEAAAIVGYEAADAADGTRNYLPVPHRVRGHLVLRMAHGGSDDGDSSGGGTAWTRGLIKTESILTPGMCGAPALDDQNRCCGVVEGIVPVHPPPGEGEEGAAAVPDYVRAVTGHAACVESPTLVAFLRSLDDGDGDAYCQIDGLSAGSCGDGGAGSGAAGASSCGAAGAARAGQAA